MKTFNKLVRDHIPAIIQKNGETCKTRILEQEEYQEELFKKLLEETNEVLAAKGDAAELVKELGDVLEVLEAIMAAHALPRDQVTRVQAQRRADRGGFAQRIFLESTE